MTVDVTADGRFVVEGRLCAAPKVDFGNGCAVLVLGDVAELIVVERTQRQGVHRVGVLDLHAVSRRSNRSL